MSLRKQTPAGAACAHSHARVIPQISSTALKGAREKANRMRVHKEGKETFK